MLLRTKKDDEEDEGEEGDDEPQRSPSPEVDPSKSQGNYQYNDALEKITKANVIKFKSPQQKEFLPDGEISLNKAKTGSALFLIYRDKAKLIRYQGQCLKNLTKIEYLNPRQDAISVIAFGPKPEGGIQKDVVKMMFNTPDECNAFKKSLESQLA